MSRVVSIAAPLALMAAASWLHFSRLERPAASESERQLTRAVDTFVANGYRDSDGRLVPLYVHDTAGNWLAPVPIYAGAAARTVTNSPNPDRIATAAIATIDVLLLYLVVKAVFGSIPLAIAAGGLLLITPAHFAFARRFTHDGIWHVAFVCGWLLALAAACGGAGAHAGRSSSVRRLLAPAVTVSHRRR